jgi:hypothetical protein
MQRQIDAATLGGRIAEWNARRTVPTTRRDASAGAAWIFPADYQGESPYRF